MTHSSTTLPRRQSYTLWCSLAIFILALAMRVPHLNQSLWYDEMYTLVEYVQQPWHKILAATPGEYVPNNHVLHTILAKFAVMFSGRACGDIVPSGEGFLRLPALIAGCLLPVALAWPLRRSAPLAALVLSAVAAMHPWLIAFSTEARGYSMLLLLGVVATNLIPREKTRWPIGYALVLAAAMYTVPIALLLAPAHAAVVFATRRGAAMPWLRGAAIAIFVALLLYLPMGRAMVRYYRSPYDTTITYREFLDQLPRFALAGERLPRAADPLLHLPDPPAAGVYWALPVLVLIVGSGFAWSRAESRPLLITLGVVSLLGVVLPLLSRAATEVRFVAWAGPWFCVAVVGIITSAKTKWTRCVAVAAGAILLAFLGQRDVMMLPNQPVREAIERADSLSPNGRVILVIYIGARESAYLYGSEAGHHEILAAHDAPGFIDAESQILNQTGRKPWLIILYEDLARRRNKGPEDSRGLWTHVTRNYQLVTRLWGRVSPVAIYAPREDSSVAAAR